MHALNHSNSYLQFNYFYSLTVPCFNMFCSTLACRNLALQDAYCAFARQSLRRNRIPIQRMFRGEDDVSKLKNTSYQGSLLVLENPDHIHRVAVLVVLITLCVVWSIVMIVYCEKGCRCHWNKFKSFNDILTPC